MQFINYLCFIRNFHTTIMKCNVAVKSILISHQNSITKTPLTHFISLRRWGLFYSAYSVNIIIFICTPRISAESHALLLSLIRYIIFTYSYFHDILRLFDVWPNFTFTSSETIRDFYLSTWHIRVAHELPNDWSLRILGN